MPIFVKIKQMPPSDKLKSGGKFYARVSTPNTLHLKDVAALIQRNCTIKYSDVEAVLEELIEVMSDYLNSSYAVKLEGIGTFKIGLKSTPAETAAEFEASKNITGSKVKFMPEYTVDLNNARVQTLTKGAKVKEFPIYTIDKETTSKSETGSDSEKEGD